ncbi:hypothetical protein AMEX_G20727, partial [Astyanax mexicanus]
KMGLWMLRVAMKRRTANPAPAASPVPLMPPAESPVLLMPPVVSPVPLMPPVVSPVPHVSPSMVVFLLKLCCKHKSAQLQQLKG